MSDPSYAYRLALHAMQLDDEGRDVGLASRWKQPVRVASTANITLASALETGDSVDGVTLAAGDRVLVKDQTTGSQNGIYIVQASGAAIRATDFDDGDEVLGTVVYVVAGTANAGKAYKLAHTTAPTIGTTALTFAEFGAGDVSAHTGDTSDAHDASAISFDATGLGNTAASDVQEAMEDFDAAITAGGGGGSLTVKDEGSSLATAATTLDFVGAGVTASGTGATKTITIPGGGGGAEDPVDDIFGTADTAFEFDTSSLTGLTAIGSPDAEDADTTIPGHYYVREAAAGSATTRIVGRYAAAPSAPFTAITKMSDHTAVGVNFLRMGGLFIGEATPGDLQAIHVIFNSGWQASTINYTTPTTFNAVVGSDIALQGFGSSPIYYAIVVNSATDCDFYVSFGGRSWLKRTDGDDPGFTIGSVGIAIDPEINTHTVSAAFDYLRIWNSALTLP